MRSAVMLILGILILLTNAESPASEDEIPGQLISMSFREADLDYVLDFFSRATGYTIVKDAEIKARVTIISQRDISVDQAFSVLNSILAVKGYALIPAYAGTNNRIVKVVPLENAKQENMEIRVGSDPAEIEPTETIVTQIMPLSSANAAQIAKDLKDLIPKYGVMIAHTQSNTLIITATSSNIKRFAQIVRELDIPMSDMIKVEVFIIKYREAETLAKVLEDLFEKPQGTSAAEQAERERTARIQRFRGRGPGGVFGPPEEETSTESATATESEILQIRSNVKVVADADTNSLIVSASQENINLIGELIEKLDKELTDQPETRVFTLEHADATEVADGLNQAFRRTTSQTFGQIGFGFRGGPFREQLSQESQGTQVTQEGGVLGLPEVNVVADERTNSVIVTTTSQQMGSISQLITQLDRDVAEYEQDTRVFPLENAEAANLARVLNELFQTTTFEQQRGRTATTSGRGGVMGTAAETLETARGLTGNVKIVAEETTNSLIITTYFRNFEKLEKIVKELDVMLPQVLIEVKIVEVTLDDDSKFGVEWMWEQATTVGDKRYAQSGTTAFKLADEIYGLKYGILGETLEGLLMSLEKNTKVNILSTPRILTLDNRQAIINIGQEVPYLESIQETATGGILTSYNYRDVGVILTVTPRINKSETVTLDVNQQINSLIEFTLFNAPVIAKREATASVTVKDSQTMIIGGIIEDNKTETVHKVPIIGSVPFIGKLFQREESKTEKTELMVFITPHIIHNPEEADEITQKQQSGLTLPKRGAMDF